jgi:UDPglucose 6-dehydrogenase
MNPPSAKICDRTSLNEDGFFQSQVVNDLPLFKKRSGLIIANRASDSLADVI